jgi:hypothetical protein
MSACGHHASAQIWISGSALPPRNRWAKCASSGGLKAHRDTAMYSEKAQALWKGARLLIDLAHAVTLSFLVKDGLAIF